MFDIAKAASDRAENASQGPVYPDSSFWNTPRRWTFGKTQDEGTSSRWTFDESKDPHSEHHTYSSRLPTSATASDIVKHSLVLLGFSLPVVVFGLVLSIPQRRNVRTDYWANAFSHCNYDGDFTLHDRPTLSLWNMSGLLIINVAWGTMSFSAAKCIDVVWDIMIGRAGQAILAWATFKVSSQYLDHAMREAPVSYDTFEALAFVPPSLVNTAKLAGDLLLCRGWRSRLAILWILCSSLFVISFSSLASAMSGYNTNSEAVVAGSGGRVINYADYQVVQFAIHDAWRIGEPAPVFITVGDACVRQGFSDADDDDTGSNQATTTYSRRGQDSQSGTDEDPFEYVPSNCSMFWRTVQYIGLYGADGTLNSSSTFISNGTKYNLNSPTLNITTSYTAASLEKLTNYLHNFRSTSPGSLKSVGELSRSTLWIFENETYSYDYILGHGTCQYKHSHNWGVSFLLLFLTTLLLVVWALGTYGMWLYVQRHPRGDNIRSVDAWRNSEGRGIYRSSWDLVEAIKKDLGSEAITPDMSEKDIRHLLRRRKGSLTSQFQGIGGTDTLCQQSAAVQDFGMAVRRRTRWKRFNQWMDTLFNKDDPAVSLASHQPVLERADWPSGTISTMASSRPSSMLNFSNQIPETG
ncbi:hypothetical protein LTS17_011702 [Exophiala oligosperma]